MHEELADIIRFAKQLSQRRITTKLRDVQCSCIVGVSEPINEIGKQSFWHTLLDTLFIVQLYYLSP